MGVDYRDCDCCGESQCDCGDSYNLCECGRMICNFCLTAPKRYDDNEDYLHPECCPYCSGAIIDLNDMLDFILHKYDLTYDEAKEMYEKDKRSD